jgi:hypothetical protein
MGNSTPTLPPRASCAKPGFSELSRPGCSANDRAALTRRRTADRAGVMETKRTMAKVEKHATQAATALLLAALTASPAATLALRAAEATPESAHPTAAANPSPLDRLTRLLTERLNLTDAQQLKTRAILTQLHEAMVAHLQAAKGDHEALTATARQWHERIDHELRTVLDDAQKAKLDQLEHGPHRELHALLGEIGRTVSGDHPARAETSDIDAHLAMLTGHLQLTADQQAKARPVLAELIQATAGEAGGDAAKTALQRADQKLRAFLGDDQKARLTELENQLHPELHPSPAATPHPA